MGEVWKARDTRLNRMVAVKRLKGQHSARFEQEARAIAALNHPHICTLFDIGQQDGVDFLVMEERKMSPIVRYQRQRYTCVDIADCSGSTRNYCPSSWTYGFTGEFICVASPAKKREYFLD